MVATLWSIGCMKMGENDNQCFLMPKMMHSKIHSVYCYRGIKKPKNIHNEGAAITFFSFSFSESFNSLADYQNSY